MCNVAWLYITVDMLAPVQLRTRFDTPRTIFRPILQCCSDIHNVESVASSYYAIQNVRVPYIDDIDCHIT